MTQFPTQFSGVRTSANSNSEGRLKVAASSARSKKKKRSILKKVIKSSY